MPGYHVEWGRAHNQLAKSDVPAGNLVQLERTEVGTLLLDLPAVELTQPMLVFGNSERFVRMRSIPPKEIPANPTQVGLADPTPWEETYEEQKLFGNIALGAFALSLLLAALAAPPVFIAVVEGAAVVSFILNRRKRREVIDIKELNGYDVTEERAQFRLSNRLLGGAVFVSILAYIVLMIVAVLAFIAFWESLFN